MQLRQLYVFFLLLNIGLFAIAGESAYRIELNIKGHNNEFVYLGYHYGPEFMVVDTAITDSNGHAVFEGKESLPQGVWFVVLPPKTRFDFLLLSEQQIVIYGDIDSIIATLTLTGSTTKDLFFDLQRDIASLNLAGSQIEIKKQYYKSAGQQVPIDIQLEEDSLKNRRIAVYQYYRNLDNKGFLANMLTLMLPHEFPSYVQQWQTDDPSAYYHYYRLHYFDVVDFSDPRILRTPEFVFHRMMLEYARFFLSTRVDSIGNVLLDVDLLVEKASVNSEFQRYVVSFLLSHYEAPSVIGMDAVFVHLVEEYFLKGRMEWADASMIELLRQKNNDMKNNLLGMKSQNLRLKNLLGDFVHIHDFNSRYLILWFWEAGCNVCDEQTPVLHEQYDDLKKYGAEVLAIYTGTDKKYLESYISDNRIHWINLYDPKQESGFYDSYGVSRTPRLFVLDADKRIVAKDVNPKDILRYLKYLDNKKK